MSRPFLIGNQNDVKYRSIDLLAAYAVCPTRQCFRFLHKAPWHASSDKSGAHLLCARRCIQFLSLQYILDLQVSHLTLEVARISEREDQCALIEHFGARIVHLGLPRVGVRVLEARLI